MYSRSFPQACSDCPNEKLDFNLRKETDDVCAQGKRILAAMSQFFAHRKDLAACQSAHYLHKCLQLRLWEESRFCSRQLKGVGVKLGAQLVAAGVDSLQVGGGQEHCC